MAIIKCKMCGGDLVIEQGNSVAECEYCGTQQTLPKVNDEVIQNLFNRANNLRLKCEFDKAEQIYEKILQQNDNDPEAHWGIILCKYGIEYVEDPKTFKRVPTCHRTSYDAITADSDYLAAIENADVVSRGIYEAEAKAIDEIQKNILNIVKNEKPFDVFICYKETDENGKRTVDSAIANDIYYQLTLEGLKVFYAAITLEDKLGQEYEPYIFAALNSAKAMLVIGTKFEYFTAVWVKNEWSRYLKLMKTDRSKLLIPCYKDMDAYDLPEEFAHLQAQDMSKIGFINDVVRGIKKVVIKDEPKTETVVKQAIVTEGNPNTAPLLKRAFMFLEDGDWKSADEYCEKVLDIDPECAEAYLGKLMSELRVCKQESLKIQAEPFDNKNNYKKAIRFAEEKLKSELAGYIEYIKVRNENVRLDEIYNRAKDAMSAANTEITYEEAARIFASIRKYQDSASLEKECYELANACKDMLKKDFDRYKLLVENYRTLSPKTSGVSKEQQLRNTIKNLSSEKAKLEQILNSFAENYNKLTSTKSEIESTKEKISALQQERSTLGLFAIKRKKEIDEEINSLQVSINNLNSKVSQIENSMGGFASTDAIVRKISETDNLLSNSKLELELAEAKSQSDTIGTIDDVINELLSERFLGFVFEDLSFMTEFFANQTVLKQVANDEKMVAKLYGVKLPKNILDKLEGTEDKLYYTRRKDRRTISQLIADFKEYFSDALFNDYEIECDVAPTYFGANPKCKPIQFLFKKDGKDKLAVAIVTYEGSTHPAITAVRDACKKHKIPYLYFIVGYPNKQHYVVRRVLEELGDIPYTNADYYWQRVPLKQLQETLNSPYLSSSTRNEIKERIAFRKKHNL